jgi:hypothetical protein
MSKVARALAMEEMCCRERLGRAGSASPASASIKGMCLCARREKVQARLAQCCGMKLGRSAVGRGGGALRGGIHDGGKLLQ